MKTKTKYGFVVALALQPLAAIAAPQMSRAPEIAACMVETEPASPPICEIPKMRPPIETDADTPKSIAAMTPFDPDAPCPAEAPSFVFPDAARQALPRCAAFVSLQAAGSRELATALGRQGLLQFAAGESDAARVTLDKALAIDPGNLIALLSKVMVMKMLGRAAVEARADIEHLKALYPDDPRVRHYYADLMSTAGMPAEALAAFESALEVAPHDMGLHSRRAGLLARLGRDGEALAERDLIVDTQPNDGYALFKRAELQLARGNAAAALADAEKARRRGFGGDETSLVVIQSNLMLGNLEKALEEIAAVQARLTRMHDTPVLTFYRFAILDRLGRKKEAEDALADFAGERREHILRIQVFLRNMGFEAVQISGAFEEATKQKLTACLLKGACSSTLQREL